MERYFDEIEVCDICGMMYMNSLKKDVRVHEIAHEKASVGLLVGEPLAKVIHRHDDVAIWGMVHNKSTTEEKEFAQQVCRTAKHATERKAGFTWWGYHPDMPVSKMDYRIYFYQVGERVVGMVALSWQNRAWLREWRATTGEIDAQRRVCVDMVWVAHEWRRKGVAHRLLINIASHLLTSLHEFAWSAPFSPDGAALVKHFCPVQYFYRG